MISKEQYKKILSKNGSLYFVDLTYKKVIEQKAQNTKFIDFSDHPEIHFYSDEGEMFWKIELKHLFESKEEAEWQLEFGNITRTETLKLPTWEEFCKAPNLKFCGAEHNLYHFFSDLKWLWLEQVVDENWTIGLYLERATKENYIKACRLAKKLFLGESDG